MEFNTLPDLLNTGFTITEIVLWWRTAGSENMQIPDFFNTRSRSLVGTLIKENDVGENTSITGQVEL